MRSKVYTNGVVYMFKTRLKSIGRRWISNNGGPPTYSRGVQGTYTYREGILIEANGPTVVLEIQETRWDALSCGCPKQHSGPTWWIWCSTKKPITIRRNIRIKKTDILGTKEEWNSYPKRISGSGHSVIDFSAGQQTLTSGA